MYTISKADGAYVKHLNHKYMQTVRAFIHKERKSSERNHVKNENLFLWKDEQRGHSPYIYKYIYICFVRMNLNKIKKKNQNREKKKDDDDDDDDDNVCKSVRNVEYKGYNMSGQTHYLNKGYHTYRVAVWKYTIFTHTIVHRFIDGITCRSIHVNMYTEHIWVYGVCSLSICRCVLSTTMLAFAGKYFFLFFFVLLLLFWICVSMVCLRI